MRVHDLEVRLTHMENGQARILASLQDMQKYFGQQLQSYRGSSVFPPFHQQTSLHPWQDPAYFSPQPDQVSPYRQLCQDPGYLYQPYRDQMLRPQRLLDHTSFGSTSGIVQGSTSRESSPPPNANTSDSVHVETTNVPCPFTPRENALSSLEIQKEKLRDVAEVLQENIKLKTEGSAGNLCQKLAKQAIFGKEVMRKCTPAGTRDYPALPQAELKKLKEIMFQQFPRFHTCPGAFETVWKRCMVAVEQACKRLCA